MEEEEWRPVDGFLDKYEVSNLGRVRSTRRWKRQLQNPHVFKAKLDRKGYVKVVLADHRQGKKAKDYLVHRLVARAFLGEIRNQEVDHINRVRSDNRASNLRITSRVINRSNQGESFQSLVANIIAMHSSGLSQSEICHRLRCF